MSMSPAVLGNQLYLAAGVISYTQVLTNTQDSGPPPKQKLNESVLTCSLSDLLPPQSPDTRRLHTPSSANKTGVWRHARDLPVTWCTLVVLGGHLLAVGGRIRAYSSYPNEDNVSQLLFNYYKPTTDVYRYDFFDDSWKLTGKMMYEKNMCLATTLSENESIIAGAVKKWSDLFSGNHDFSSAEIMCFQC